MYAFSSSIWIAVLAVLVGPVIGLALFMVSSETVATDASNPKPLITTAMRP